MLVIWCWFCTPNKVSGNEEKWILSHVLWLGGPLIFVRSLYSGQVMVGIRTEQFAFKFLRNIPFIGSSLADKIWYIKVHLTV